MNSELILLLVLCAMAALGNLVRGIADLCGKWISPKMIARVAPENRKAWQRWNAGFYFALAALWAALFAIKLVTRNACLPPESPLRTLPSVMIMLGIMLLGVTVYVNKRYTGKYF